jgi:hypothetical protein
MVPYIPGIYGFDAGQRQFFPIERRSENRREIIIMRVLRPMIIYAPSTVASDNRPIDTDAHAVDEAKLMDRTR